MPDVDELARRRECRRLRALVADDDDAIRRLLAAVLALDGWDVQCASDGDEALALAAEYQPDAVLLDVMMPHTDGLATLRALRATEGGWDYAVLMVSALAEAEAEAEARDAGCDDYLVKPLEIDEVSDRVLRLVRKMQQRPTADSPPGA